MIPLGSSVISLAPLFESSFDDLNLFIVQGMRTHELSCGQNRNKFRSLISCVFVTVSYLRHCFIVHTSLQSYGINSGRKMCYGVGPWKKSLIYDGKYVIAYFYFQPLFPMTKVPRAIYLNRCTDSML